MLKPTLKLAAQLAAAYDEIRQQSNNLMTFTEVRTDPLTGVSNRRAFDETLESMFAMMHRYEHAIFAGSIGHRHFQANQRRARPSVRRPNVESGVPIDGR